MHIPTVHHIDWLNLKQTAQSGVRVVAVIRQIDPCTTRTLNKIRVWYVRIGRRTFQTRKLRYRKDDRAMRPIYGSPENSRESLSTPTATFAEILMAFCSDRSHERVYKIWTSYSFTRSWDNMGTQKIWAVPWYAHAPFSPKFSWALVRMDPLKVAAKFEVRGFTLSWDNSGYSKNWEVPIQGPWIHPSFLFSKIFHALVFGWTL